VALRFADSIRRLPTGQPGRGRPAVAARGRPQLRLLKNKYGCANTQPDSSQFATTSVCSGLAKSSPLPCLFIVLRESALLKPLLLAVWAEGPMLMPQTQTDDSEGTLTLESHTPTGRVAWPVRGAEGGDNAVWRYLQGLCGAAVPSVFTRAPSVLLGSGVDYEAMAALVAGLLVAGHPHGLLDHLCGDIKTSDIPAAAVAAKGDLETLRWLRADGWRFNCSSVAAHAASTGQLRVREVAWLVLPAAVAGGFLPVLQLLVTFGFPAQDALVAAVGAGRSDMVHCLVDEHKLHLDPSDSKPCSSAAKRGDFSMLQFLTARGYVQGMGTCYMAALGGQLKVLQWFNKLHAHAQTPPCLWDSNTCWWAARKGHLEVLRWALSQEPACPLRGCEAEAAARGGHIHVVEFLVEQGQPLHPYVCAAAVEGGHLDALKWLRSRDPLCPWDEDSVGPAALEEVCPLVSDEAWDALRTWLAANTPYY